MEKILVIDGNSIINRAFYGIRPLTTKTGKHTNAIFGMVNMIMKQLDAVKPDYVAVAFDIKHPTFRHQMYDGYKAGRNPTPEELLSQFDDAKECLRLMGISVLELPGWEADDIQGTIAGWANGSDELESYVFSGDRDLLQLITDKVTILLATNTDTLTMKREEFRAKYGIEPEYFVDMKALMGDSSDNIPGVAGIGEKTAAGLISAFSTLDGIYDSIDDPRIKKGVREKLLCDKDNAYLSRTLAKIDTNAPVGVTLEDIRYKGPDKRNLHQKFLELELHSLISKYKIDLYERGDAPQETVADTHAEYKAATAADIVRSENESLAIELGDVIRLAIGDRLYTFEGKLSELSHVLYGDVLVYDGKALWHALKKDGLNPSIVNYIDLMMYEYVLSPGGKNAGVASLATMFLGKAVEPNAPTVHLYKELENVLGAKIKEDGLDTILRQLELPLIPVLAECEDAGFMIDKAGILEFREALMGVADELTRRIYVAAGEVFNLNSPKQLGEILYEKLALVPAKKGKYPTDAQTLEDMRHLSPIIDDILEYRHVTKLASTYTTALTDVADEESRIHTDFKQAQTATGRLSSAEPNLQNIPIRTKLGRQMRSYFVAKEGYTLVDADYSQIELRLLAHISGDYNMSEAFRTGEDIHRKTAAAVFGLPEEYVTEDMRKRAKAVNFGIVYGISGFSLAKDIGTTVQEATKYIKNYLYNYPFIDNYLEDVVAEANEKGYTTTPMGRRRYIPELRAANAPMRAFGKRVAMNAPIQGAAADIMKLAMIKVRNAIKEANLDARIVMQVHDELVIEVRDDMVNETKELVKRVMEGVVDLTVPLTVDVTSGKNWLDQE